MKNGSEKKNADVMKNYPNRDALAVGFEDEVKTKAEVAQKEALQATPVEGAKKESTRDRLFSSV